MMLPSLRQVIQACYDILKAEAYVREYDIDAQPFSLTTRLSVGSKPTALA